MVIEIDIPHYFCEHCNSDYLREEEAKGCEAQGPPPKVLPRGTAFITIFSSQHDVEIIATTYDILVSRKRVDKKEHRNVYNAIGLRKYRDLIVGPFADTAIVERSGETLSVLDPTNCSPRRMSESEVEKLCQEDPKFREAFDMAMPKV